MPRLSAGYEIAELGREDIERVSHLFKQLVGSHREVVAGAWPVRDPEAAWAIRRRQYEEWLGEGSARMLVVVPAGEPEVAPLGYAVLSVKPSMASWDVGERVGEIETLAVDEGARGGGIGTLLIEACRERLRAAGVSHWAVGVVEANEDATHLYERAGFRPYYREMLGEV